MAALMEWVASDIVGSRPLLFKARCLKAQAFIEIGYINEAFQVYQIMLEMKDLPSPGVRPSPFQLKQNGTYIGNSIAYNNDQPTTHEANQSAL